MGGNSAVTDRVRLSDVAILADPDEPSYVAYGIDELRRYLARVAHATPILLERWDEGVGARHLVIAVGQSVLRRLRQQGVATPEITPSSPGPEGFVLRSTTWPATHHPLVIVGGGDAQGTKHGLIELIKAIDLGRHDATLALPLDRVEKPSFTYRGMYAFSMWAYNHPYALRTWSLDDWKRYVDLLAYLHVNLLQIWPLVALLPHPLSAADRAYLEKIHDVVAYAKAARGMEVWIGECANNVAASDGGVPVERREYFAVETRKDPADPAQVQDIMASREDLYSIVDNADGHWIIDGDPGGWPDSPVSEFVDLMAGNRQVIDRVTEKGRAAKLVYWMHWGWSNWGWQPDRPETPGAIWRATLDEMARRLPQTYWLTPNVHHLDLVGELGLLERSIFYPYATIEWEPSPPLTQLHHARLREMVEVALAHPGLAGVMGNAQTPLVQLPNIFFFLNALWHAERRHESVAESARHLAALVYPTAADLVGQAWTLLGSESPEDVLGMADRLEEAIGNGDLSPVGPLGQFIFPEPERVATDLTYLLRIKGYAEQFRSRLQAGDSMVAVRDSLAHYVRTVLSWQERHGYHAMGGAKYIYNQYLTPVQTSWQPYAERVRREGEHRANFDVRWPVKAQLTMEGQFPSAAIDLVLLEATSPQPLRS
jgi:hypothetical protein